MSGRPNKVTAFINAYTSGASGGDIRFVEVFRRLSDIDLTIVTPEQGVGFCRERGLAGDYVPTSGQDSASSVLFTYPLRAARAMSGLKGRDLGVLYSTSDFLPDVLPPFVLCKKGARWVQVVHHLIPAPWKREGSLAKNSISYLMQRLSLLLVKMRADVVVVVSERVRESLIGMGFEPGRVRVNPNGVDMGYFETLQPVEPAYEGAFLARLHRSKGVMDLVEIWGRVCERFPGARLAVIGDGDEQIKAELSAAIRSRGLEKNVTLLGFLPRDQALGVIRSAKVFVFPSHEEGFGIAILEAMACGLPVVGWDLPVYREVFGSGGMITVPRGEHGNFAERVARLLADNGERERLSAAAGRTARRFDWQEIAEREMTFLR